MDSSHVNLVPLDVFRSLVDTSLTGVYLVQGGRLAYANRRRASIDFRRTDLR
jgi:hypothetical protein